MLFILKEAVLTGDRDRQGPETLDPRRRGDSGPMWPAPQSHGQSGWAQLRLRSA